MFNDPFVRSGVHRAKLLHRFVCWLVLLGLYGHFKYKRLYIITVRTIFYSIIYHSRLLYIHKICAVDPPQIYPACTTDAHIQI